MAYIDYFCFSQPLKIFIFKYENLNINCNESEIFQSVLHSIKTMHTECRSFVNFECKRDVYGFNKTPKPQKIKDIIR